jgi:hypothetical protein
MHKRKCSSQEYVTSWIELEGVTPLKVREWEFIYVS